MTSKVERNQSALASEKASGELSGTETRPPGKMAPARFSSALSADLGAGTVGPGGSGSVQPHMHGPLSDPSQQPQPHVPLLS